MARLSLNRNRKFKLLAQRLQIPKPYVRGLLETMWECAHESVDPVLGDANGVEAAAEWPGEAGVLADALHQEGFIDLREDGLFEIHDYWENCPRYVRQRSDRRQTETDRASLYKRRQKSSESRKTAAEIQDKTENGGPPARARSRPAPEYLSLNVGGSGDLPAETRPEQTVSDPGQESPDERAAERVHRNDHREMDLLKDYVRELLNKLEGITDPDELRRDEGLITLIARGCPREIVHAAQEAMQDHRLRALDPEFSGHTNHARYFVVVLKRLMREAGYALPFRASRDEAQDARENDREATRIADDRAKEAAEIRCARKLLQDLQLEWGAFHVHALQAVSRYRPHIAAAVKRTWDDHRLRKFPDTAFGWWDQFTTHCDQLEKPSEVPSENREEATASSPP